MVVFLMKYAIVERVSVLNMQVRGINNVTLEEQREDGDRVEYSREI